MLHPLQQVSLLEGSGDTLSPLIEMFRPVAFVYLLLMSEFPDIHTLCMAPLFPSLPHPGTHAVCHFT